jgi:predicted amidohydrolase
VDPTLIAVAQLAITVAEPDANRRAAADAVADAAASGARLVVLPELCDSGYVFDAAGPAAEARGLAAPAADSATLRQWHELAARHRLVIVGGFCELGADGRLYNSAALVDASGTRAVYRKAHLWDSEKLVFTPGDAALPTVDTELGRVAVMVCYDLEFPEWTRLAALDGADLIAAPVNWPGYSWPEGERPAEVVKAQAAAAANGVFVAVADRCRTERGVSWISGSLIASPEGYTLAGPVLADRPAVRSDFLDYALEVEWFDQQLGKALQQFAVRRAGRFADGHCQADRPEVGGKAPRDLPVEAVLGDESGLSGPGVGPDGSQEGLLRS